MNNISIHYSSVVYSLYGMLMLVVGVSRRSMAFFVTEAPIL